MCLLHQSKLLSQVVACLLQEADTTFPLRAEHWNLTRYLNMVLETDWQDDIDVAR